MMSENSSFTQDVVYTIAVIAAATVISHFGAKVIKKAVKPIRSKKSKP